MADNKYKGMNLEQLREQIDDVDSKILELFRERMALSSEIARVKKNSGLAILDIDREKEKLNRIAKNVEDELSGFSSKLYLTLADLSKEYQSKLFNVESIDESNTGDDD